MAKFVQPIFDVHGVATFKNTTTFENDVSINSSIFFNQDFIIDGTTISGIDTQVTGISKLGSNLLTSEIFDSHLEKVRMYTNTGLTAVPTFTTNGDGTFNLGDASARLYNNSTNSGPVNEYQVTGISNITPADNEVTFVTVDYNSGNPIYSTTQDVNDVNTSNVIPVYTIYRYGIIIDKLSWDSAALGFNDKMLQRIAHTERFVRESGLALAENAGRVITISAGAAWYGITGVSLAAIQSDTTPTSLWTTDGATWSNANVTQYNNTLYQGVAGTVALTAGHYGVNWIYRNLDEDQGRIFTLLGTDSYPLLSTAEIAQPPADMPDVIKSNSILIGKIIVLNGASSSTGIQSAFDEIFVGTPITNHNDLSAIQGGTAGEYYHLTNDELVTVQTLDASFGEVYNYVDGQIVIVDASITGINTRLDNHDTSIGVLEGLISSNDTDILANQNAIIASDASIGLLVIEDSSLASAISALEDATVSSGNGLTTTGSVGNYVIELGGSLDKNTSINATGFTFDVGSDWNSLNINDLTEKIILSSASSVFSSESQLELNANTGINLTHSTTGADYGFIINAFVSADQRIKVNSGPMAYAADYNSLMTSDLNVPDLGWVKNYVDSSIVSNSVTATNGLTKTLNAIGLGGTLTGDTGIITAGFDFSVTGDFSVIGNLVVDGSLTSVNSVNLDVSDNIITINSGETGTGVTAVYAGLKIDRGLADPYMFIFDETTNTFRVGIGTEGGLPTGTQAVATREDTPTNTGLSYWDTATSKFATNSNLTYNGTTLTVSSALTLSGLASQGSEHTVLSLNASNEAGYIELGDAAFAGTTTATATGPINISGTSNVLSATAISIDQSNTTTDGYLSSTDWNTFNTKVTSLDDLATGTSLLLNGGTTTPDIKGLIGGDNITLTPSGTDITIDVDSVTATATGPIQISGTNNVLSSTAISINLADTATDGYVRSEDWNIFNNKVNTVDSSGGGLALIAAGSGATNADVLIRSLAQGNGITLSEVGGLITVTADVAGAVTTATATGPINVTGTDNVVSSLAISIDTANTTTTGALTFTDWNKFNNKVNTITKAGIGISWIETGSGAADADVTLKSITSGSSIIVTDDTTSIDLDINKGNLSVTGPLVIDSGTGTGTTLEDLNISIVQATNLVSGYLSDTDWITFNNKIDSVVSTGGSGVAIYGGEDPTGTAKIKTLVAGTGTTVTSDATTITVSVDTTATSLKYTGSFTSNGIDTFTILASAHGLGTGPFITHIYEGTELVHVGVTYDGSGNITFDWLLGSITGTCNYIITG